MKNRTSESRSAKEAARKAASTPGRVAILLGRKRLVVAEAEARRLAAAGAEFAYLCTDKKTGRVLTVPVNPEA